MTRNRKLTPEHQILQPLWSNRVDLLSASSSFWLCRGSRFEAGFPGLQIVLLSHINANISTIIPVYIYSVKMTFLFSLWLVRRLPLCLTTYNKVDIDDFDWRFWLAIDYGSERTERLTFQTHRWDVLAERNPTPQPLSQRFSTPSLVYLCLYTRADVIFASFGPDCECI